MTGADVWDIVAGTGHRPQHLLGPQRTWLRERIPAAVRYLAAEHGMRAGISGMAIGFDLWWAQAIVDAGLDLWAYVPCPQQTVKWSSTDRREWKRLLDQAAKVRYISEFYYPGVMHVRNHAMLSDAHALVAGWRTLKRSGGTFDAVNHARRNRLPGVLLDVDHQHTRLVTYPRKEQLVGA